MITLIYMVAITEFMTFAIMRVHFEISECSTLLLEDEVKTIFCQVAGIYHFPCVTLLKGMKHTV